MKHSIVPRVTKTIAKAKVHCIVSYNIYFYPLSDSFRSTYHRPSQSPPEASSRRNPMESHGIPRNNPSSSSAYHLCRGLGWYARRGSDFFYKIAMAAMDIAVPEVGTLTYLLSHLLNLSWHTMYTIALVRPSDSKLICRGHSF